MIKFEATIKKFEKKGEKSGWTYLEVPAEIAEHLFPGNKKSFRIKGFIDCLAVNQVALLPMGDGSFILVLNAAMRKVLKKVTGNYVQLAIITDTSEKPVSPELLTCLEDDPTAFEFFKTLTKGHQRYFSNWIESAKTEQTKAKRITQAVIALSMGLGYSEMIRENKNKPLA